MQHTITEKDALIIVDVQNDFCAGGALPVPDGDEVIPVLNDYIHKFRLAGAEVLATRDWHPPDHSSFQSQGGPWPEHCVRSSYGAQIRAGLNLPRTVRIIDKGKERAEEGYSGFEGGELEEELHKRGIERLFIGGLATDYCVKHTVLDGLKNNFGVVLLNDATRGIDANPGDLDSALKEMKEAGAESATIEDIISA